MTQKTISLVRDIAVAGMTALVISGPALAETRPEVLERIAPVGRVHVAGQPAPAAKPVPPAPAAAPAPAPAPAAPAPVPASEQPAEPAPAPAAEAPAPEAPAVAAPAPEAPAAAGGGEKIYRTVCFACHDAGVANAPKLGDKEAWKPRIAQGMDVMMNSAINGKTAMPPRGTCMACTDDDLRAAIEFMVSKSQ